MEYPSEGETKRKYWSYEENTQKLLHFRTCQEDHIRGVKQKRVLRAYESVVLDFRFHSIVGTVCTPRLDSKGFPVSTS
jgi:hypothetical protein